MYLKWHIGFQLSCLKHTHNETINSEYGCMLIRSFFYLLFWMVSPPVFEFLLLFISYLIATVSEFPSLPPSPSPSPERQFEGKQADQAWTQMVRAEREMYRKKEPQRDRARKRKWWTRRKRGVESTGRTWPVKWKREQLTLAGQLSSFT